MKFIVIGDLILDKFIYGDINRISPEAPVPILDVTKKINVAGGAYNVHAHLINLGCFSTFMTVVGEDFESLKFDFFDDFNSSNSFFFPEKNRKTSLKTRLIAVYNHNHQIRYDEETVKDIDDDSENKIIAKLSKIIDNETFIILNDYKKGVISKNLTKKIIKISKKYDAKIFVDSKRNDVSQFKNSYLLKPNKYEFNQIQLRFGLSKNFEQACKELVAKLNLKYLIVTMGDDGIHCCDDQLNYFSIPSIPVNVKELSGAGDSVLSILAVAINKGYDIYKSVKIANKIASIFIATGPTYRAKIEDFNLYINEN